MALAEYHSISNGGSRGHSRVSEQLWHGVIAGHCKSVPQGCAGVDCCAGVIAGVVHRVVQGRTVVQGS